MGTLMLRRVAGLGELGPLFWAADVVPKGFGPASAAAGVLTLNQTDGATRADVALLRADLPSLPCGDSGVSGTTKCEAVLGGAQDYEHLPRLRASRQRALALGGAARRGPPRGHGRARVPESQQRAVGVYARAGGVWADVALTGVPNDDSNINAGALPGGAGTYLVANAVPHRARDPLTVAFAPDGLNFSSAFWVMSCTEPPFPHNQSCVARGAGGASGGPRTRRRSPFWPPRQRPCRDSMWWPRSTKKTWWWRASRCPPFPD